MGRSRSSDRDKDAGNSRRSRRSSSSSGSSGSSSSSRSSSSRSRSSSKDRDRTRDRDRDRDRDRIRNRDPRTRYSNASSAGHRSVQGSRLDPRIRDRNNRPYSPKSKRQAELRPGYPGEASGWYAQPYPPTGTDGHAMPPFQNFYNAEQGYPPPDYQGQFGPDYAYTGYDPTYYGAPPEFQGPPHDYGMTAPGGNWDGNNIVYPDVSVPPPPAPVIPPNPTPPGPDMVPPPPAALVPEPYNEAKKEAVEQELVLQNRSLAMQRDEYIKKKSSLNRELSRLKDQKRELVKENSKDNERILRENAKLQAEILQKLKSIDNVIEMFSSIIGYKDVDEPKKDSSRSESKKSEKSEKRKRSPSPRSETPKKKVLQSPEKSIPEDKGKSSEYGKVNIIHYDPEMHWCAACEEFPRTLNEYLMHLHSNDHKANTADQKDEKPWVKDEVREMSPPYIKDAMSKRVPLRGAQFLIPSAAWYCSMCKTWLGDLDRANKHLRSSVHTSAYNAFISQNPHWEVDWLTERTRAYERRSETKRPKTKTDTAELSYGNLSDQIIAMLNSRKADAKEDSSSSSSSSDSDSGRRRREKKSKKKKSKKKKKEKESKKAKSASPKKEKEIEKPVERPPPVVEEIKPPEPEPPKPVAEPPRFHDMNFTPAFHPEMKYKFNSKGVFEETKMNWEEPKPIPKPTIDIPPTPVPAPAPAPAPAPVPSPEKESKEKKVSPKPQKKDKRDRSHEADDDRRSRRSSRDRERSHDRRYDRRRYDRDRDRDRDRRDRDRGFSSKDYYGPKEPPKKGGRRDRKTPERDKSDKSKRLYLPGMEDDEEANCETAFEKRTSESAAKKKDEKKKTSFVIPKTRLPFIGRMPILKKKVDQKDDQQQSDSKDESLSSGSALELMNEMSVEGEETRQSAGGGEENNAEDTSGEEETPVTKPTVMIGKRRNYKNRADDNLMEQDMEIEEELIGKEEAKEHNAELHRDFKEALDLLFPEQNDGQFGVNGKAPEVPKVTTQITTSAPPQPYTVYDMSMYDPATAAAYSMYYDPSVYVQQYMAMGYDQASAIQAVQAAYGVDPTMYMHQQAAAMTVAAVSTQPAPLPPEPAPPAAVATATETTTTTATEAPIVSTVSEPPVDPLQSIPEPSQSDATPAEERDEETLEAQPESKPKRKNPLSQRMRRHLKMKAEKEAAEKAIAENEPNQDDVEERADEEEKAEPAETPADENGIIEEEVPESQETPEVDKIEVSPVDTNDCDSEATSDSVKKSAKVEEMSELALLGIEEDDITAQSFF